MSNPDNRANLRPCSIVTVTETWSGEEDEPVKISGDWRGASYVFSIDQKHLHGVWQVSARALHPAVGSAIEIGQVGVLCPRPDELSEDCVDVWRWGKRHIKVGFNWYDVDEIGRQGVMEVGQLVRVVDTVERHDLDPSLTGGPTVLLLIEAYLGDDDFDTELGPRMDFSTSYQYDYDCETKVDLGGDPREYQVEAEQVGRGCTVLMELRSGKTEKARRSSVWVDADNFMSLADTDVEEFEHGDSIQD